MSKYEIEKIKKEAQEAIQKTQNLEEWEKLRIKYLGKKSKFKSILRGIKDLPTKEKRKIGPLVQQTKLDIINWLESKKTEIEDKIEAKKEWIDVTAPGIKPVLGHLHPLTIVQREIEDIFIAAGFDVVEGPEVETEFYNFDAVNIPSDHPGRDMQDTFWISHKKNRKAGEGIVLRTQTSSVQVRYMEKHQPPFRIIIPGRVFRNEATDASHEHTFHQFEALVVDKEVSVANFLAVAEMFFTRFFGEKTKIRLRPSYFPFVEPGFEFDISCTSCGGKGCRVCQQTGWLEVGGAGMVHQNVFQTAGYPRGKYQGFAWGFGLERLAMMKYKIDDIRLFHSGDLRFIRQF